MVPERCFAALGTHDLFRFAILPRPPAVLSMPSTPSLRPVPSRSVRASNLDSGTQPLKATGVIGVTLPVLRDRDALQVRQVVIEGVAVDMMDVVTLRDRAMR
jgi:hypothetical protein